MSFIDPQNLDTHVGGVDEDFHQAQEVPKSNVSALGGKPFRQTKKVSASNVRASDESSPLSIGNPLPKSIGTVGTPASQQVQEAQQDFAAGVISSPTETDSSTLSIASSAPLADSLLLIHSDLLDDLERVRIATANRVRALQQVKGMADSPEEHRLKGLVEALSKLEHEAELELQRDMRAHPLGNWVKATQGVGLKQAARLLAAIGDPGERLNVAKLWAYCGYHVIDGAAPRHRKGVKANWSNTAKMRARLIAESCMKNRNSPYRAVYDMGRAKYADLEISDGHKHNRALRLVAKEVLKDLWKEARSIQELPEDLVE